jgi:hypothetical protein
LDWLAGWPREPSAFLFHVCLLRLSFSRYMAMATAVSRSYSGFIFETLAIPHHTK